jgi:cap1 methyltransferase
MVNAKLFFAEIVTALTIQDIGGVFILKIYDCTFEITKQMITLLSAFYKKVSIIKPATSRPANS